MASNSLYVLVFTIKLIITPRSSFPFDFMNLNIVFESIDSATLYDRYLDEQKCFGNTAVLYST